MEDPSQALQDYDRAVTHAVVMALIQSHPDPAAFSVALLGIAQLQLVDVPEEARENFVSVMETYAQFASTVAEQRAKG